MKKIVFLVAAMMLFVCLDAQVVLGLQGGYFNQKNTNSINADYTSNATMLGGMQVGYQVLPQLYVGVMGSYLSNTNITFIEHDKNVPIVDAHSSSNGMRKDVDNHQFTYTRLGWEVSPIVKYEVLAYGNMHFNIQLQGTIRSMGYKNIDERYVKPFDNNEAIDFDDIKDSVSLSSWGISLRPTLLYEFSQHLSAELSLDFLSLGYICETEHHDNTVTYAASDPFHNNPIKINPYTTSQSTLYAGVNTLMNLFSWENPLLRLGFNWKF